MEPFTPIAKDLLGGPPPAGLSHHLRDLAHQVRHTEAAVTGIDTLLNSVADAHLTRVGIRQNEDMRRISAWAAIPAGPTVIASVYGMDFERIPGLSWDHGYPVVAMLIPGLVIYIMFRRNKWL